MKKNTPKYEELVRQKRLEGLDRAISERQKKLTKIVNELKRLMLIVGEKEALLRELIELPEDLQRSFYLFSDEQQKALNLPVDELELTVRAHNCLASNNVRYIGDLLNITPSKLVEFDNLGKKTYCEICDKLREKGFELGMAKERGLVWRPNDIGPFMNKPHGVEEDAHEVG